MLIFIDFYHNLVGIFFLIHNWFLPLSFFCFIKNTGKNLGVSNGYEEEDRPSKSEGGGQKNQTEREFIQPPPPPPKKISLNSREKQGPAVARAQEDDIFVGDGVDYEVPGKDGSHSPLSEDMEESPRNKEKPSYFTEPSYGPVPPSVMPQGWQEAVSWWS